MEVEMEETVAQGVAVEMEGVVQGVARMTRKRLKGT